MRIAGKKKLVQFMERHPGSASSLRSWVQVAETSEWKAPTNIKQTFARTSFRSRNRVVFNIGGNRFRLLVVVIYVQRNAIVNWLGTHAEYDKMNF
ncbi:MAG: type II toxin-antitoxin system HigB family toxin [Lentisphaeria bacterium]|nr:type II toxin-antitoxin system HigB family toxin [Lentisphaeria bacterium]